MEVEDVEYLQDYGRTREGPVTHYTYVALQFRRAYIKYHSTRQTARKIIIRCAHHITLAYLPWTTSRVRRKMDWDMNELLAEWIAIKPSGRPSCLLTSRSFLIKRRAGDFVGDDGPCEFDRWPGSDIYTSGRSDFINTKWEQICQLVDNNLLSFICTPKEIVKKMETDGIDVVPPEFVKKVCAKYYERELRRLHKASEIEKECRPKYHDEAVIEILLREAVVSKCSEVRSLLHYLRELLVFKISVFHMRPAHDVGLHNEDSWHVTPQTNELYAKRQGLSTPTHKKYVECYWPSESS